MLCIRIFRSSQALFVTISRSALTNMKMILVCGNCFWRYGLAWGQLPNGFDYEVSEGGKELSGGQRQTVALARSLMRKPNYLLFDEPTANMDTGTEQMVLSGLKEHLSNETMIIVTHRMAPLNLVDRIIVLENGRVAIDGPRDLVIQRLQTKQSA